MDAAILNEIWQWKGTNGPEFQRQDWSAQHQEESIKLGKKMKIPEPTECPHEGSRVESPTKCVCFKH